MLGVVGHRVHDRHGFLATGRGRDRLGVVGVLLGVPLHQGLVIAAFTRAQRAGAGFGGQDLLDAVAVVATGHHRNGQRAIGMPDDVHAGPYPFSDRLTRGARFARAACSTHVAGSTDDSGGGWRSAHPWPWRLRRDE